jgi:2-methylcitrate dehydratase PrpD
MTRQLAQFVAATDQAAIPDAFYEHAKVALLDWIGVTLASREEPLVKLLLQFVDHGGGNEQSAIVGYGVKKTATQAALVNGAASHAMDFDDTMAEFWGHPSASLFASLLALGELERKNGRDLLASYLIGLKAGLVVADSVGEEMYAGGFHCTSTLGIIASGAACARLLGLDEPQTTNALGLAATQSFGLKGSFGTMCKPFHAGHAAEGAVMGALLAREGFTGADDILEGPNGLLEAFGGAVNDYAMGSLGRTWGVERLAQKYHASCHWTHSAIEAASAIKTKNGVQPQDITSIEIICSGIALATADVEQPRTGLEGKFSFPYCVANALVTGDTGLAAFTDEAVRSPEISSLIEKTTVRSHPKAENFDSRVIIETGGGERYVEDVNVMEELPALDEKRVRVREKFTGIASPILGARVAERVVEAVLNLENFDDVSQLIAVVNS